MTIVAAGVVDVHLLRWRSEGGWEVLALRRGPHTRCTGAWEVVHGRIEAGESPEHAALREIKEETALPVERLYNVTVQPFYLHGMGTVQLAVVFAAVVADGAPILSDEHDAWEWISEDEALARLAWPREKAGLQDALALLRDGTAGAVEDVLRVV